MQDQPFHVTSPAPREVWQELLQADANTLVYQTPTWLDCICAMGGYQDASRLYELPSGRRLVLPMARRHLPQPLTTTASLPHGWGMGGLIASGTVQVEDVAAVFADLARGSALRTSIRPNPLTATTWATARPPKAITVPHVTHMLDLEGGFEQVWSNRFKPDTRYGVRKAERTGLVVECDTSGKLVPVFYDLYLRWVDRRAEERRVPLPIARWTGRRREPLRKFQLVAQAFGDACRIWVARLDGQPAAAAIQLVHSAAAIYWRSASDKELAGPTRANDLLQRLMIEDACRAGCRYYHMGESGGVASLMHFKSRFGAREYHYDEYYLERLPISSVQGRLQGLARGLEAQLLRRRSAAPAGLTGE